MKLFCALAALAACAFATVNPQLHQVKKVYILAMGSGMDQYLANQITKAGVFEVVTDPKQADAIVSDNVGEMFEKKLDDIYPPPPKPSSSAKAVPDATQAGVIDVGDSSTAVSKKDPLDGIDFAGGNNRASSLSRGKGNFFVVDRNSRIVLWSVYERPKNSSSGELTKTAARVVKHLKEDLTGKKPEE
jgi:hypothetical protein